MIFSCHGYEITTIEGIGNRLIGYHEIQTRLAEFNGTQCGYCSPGMVMNMYSLLEANDGQVTMKDIENSFGGNICRCTGYRPILDAFKTFAIDADQELLDRCGDIEDLQKVICPKTGNVCNGFKCEKLDEQVSSQAKIQLVFDEKPSKEWIKVYTLGELFECFESIGSKVYHLSAGNTAHGKNFTFLNNKLVVKSVLSVGVFRRRNDIQIFIDISDIEDLRSHSIHDEAISIGGAVSLTETMQILGKAAKIPGFEYCEQLLQHIDLIANVPVRNVILFGHNL